MKTLVLACAAATLAGTSLTPAWAKDSEDEIVVTPARAMEAWRTEVSRDLDRKLLLAVRQAGYNPDSGIVQLRFRLDGAGRPAALETVHSSGSHASDQAAMWAVRRLSGLGRVPTAVTGSTVFQANIIFAQSRQERDALATRLAWIERARLARGSAEREVVALGM